MPIPEIEILNSLVSRVFRIDDFTIGDPAQGAIARYRGQLISEDSVSAYDQLADSLKPYDITPMFRLDHGQQLVFLAPKKPDPKPTRVSINIVLFILTVLSVMLVGAQQSVAPTSPGVLGQIIAFIQSMLTGWPYALSLMSILLAHEFGHYFISRHHKTAATLPYFIPLPFPPLGTMGAAILMQSTPKNKRVLFDIGVAGPLAGIIVAIPILFYGLSLSHLAIITPVNGAIEEEGNSLLYLLAKYLMFGKFLPAPDQSAWNDLRTVLAAIFLHRPACSRWRNGRIHQFDCFRGLGRIAGHRAQSNSRGHIGRRPCDLFVVWRFSQKAFPVYLGSIDSIGHSFGMDGGFGRFSCSGWDAFMPSRSIKSPSLTPAAAPSRCWSSSSSY